MSGTVSLPIGTSVNGQAEAAFVREPLEKIRREKDRLKEASSLAR